MQRNFVLPAAVALGFHAVLLFGFRSGPPILRTPAEPPPKVEPLPPDVVEWVTPEPAGDPASPDNHPASARPMPDLVEPPPADPGVHLTIPVTEARPFSGPADLPIVGPITAGDGAGPGGGRGPVSAVLLDHAPRTRTQVAPLYPYEARVAGRPGEVLVEFTVTETGQVTDPHVLRASEPVFEPPTLQAVAKWRFEPGRRNGRVVRFRMTVPVAFSVNS